MMYCKDCQNNRRGKCSYDLKPTTRKGFCHLDEEYAFEIALMKAKISNEEWATEQAMYNEVKYD